MLFRSLKTVFAVAAASFVMCGTHPLLAQQVQTGGRTNTGAASSPGAGGTTEGLAGLTTQGLATDGAAEGGFAGANAAQTFVGGGGTDGGFVGGGREATAGLGGGNRQFRGITDQGIFGGNGQQQTSSPRRIPVSFRVNFVVPQFSRLRSTGGLAAANDVGVQRFTALRPQLSGINVTMTDAGIVRLSGAVPDASSRRLAANLMRLQPGVRSIDNQLQIQSR